jgi:hypothetical protein
VLSGYFLKAMQIIKNSAVTTLEEFLANLIDHTKWLDGHPIAKTDMTAKTWYW